MSFSPSSQQVVCKEVFDDSSEPTEDEIRDYATKIGIDIRNESHLLSFARDCLMQPLPPEWMACYTAEHPDPYYFNVKTKNAQWIHPLEEVHKAIIAKIKNETLSDQFDEESRTTVKEDLKSFEEALRTESLVSDMLPKPRLLAPLAPIPPRGALRAPPNTLGPLKMASPATPVDVKKVSFDENEVKKRPNSSDIRHRRNIDPLEFRHLSKQEIMTTKTHWRDEGYATESSATQQLTLAGGGGMFLKKTTTEGSPIKKSSNADDNESEKSVPFKLEKELRVNFEIPDADDLSSRKSDLKQIEIDFEDLEINLEVPKEKPKTAAVAAAMSSPRTKESSQDKTSRNFKKSINIVLNGKSQEDNLIDLTDAESASSIGAEPFDTTSVPAELDQLINLNPVAVHSIEDIDRTKQNLDAAKAEKLKVLEGDFNNWVKNTENIFREKRLQSFNNFNEKYEDWKKNEENGIIKEMGDRSAEELQVRVKTLRNELLREEQEAVENLRTTLATQTRDRLRAIREEIQAREEIELADLQKSLQESLSRRKEEMYHKHEEEMKRIERNLEKLLAEQRMQRQLELEKARQDEAALAEMRAQLKDAFLQQKTVLQQEHEMALQKLKQQHEVEIFQAAVNPKPHDVISPRLGSDDSSKQKTQNGKEPSDPIIFEKMRCEKRLLEDKYKSLKEKYLRLKTDLKSTLDKKTSKKLELPQSASETEKSTSFKGNKVGDLVESPNLKRRTDDKKLKLKKQLNHLDNVNQNVEADNSKNGRGELSPSRGRGGDSSDDDDQALDDAARASSRKRRQLFSKLKAASTSRLHSGHRHDKDDAVSPVENLRRQLKKLEELEDQFPVSTHTDTYMRYPFTDAPAPQFASSELEFFKHRIHLERDSVRRAKEFLKTQKKCYENRQRELQHRLMDGPSSKSILEKIHQEERELTEMEVSVHRTRALLGEKIIRLRHLEHSLRRAAPERRTYPAAPRSASREDGTLSDLSSHSDSSGFSSTHHISEPIGTGPRATIEKNRRHLQTSFQESSEIIQSLENLNTEIRGIWEVLKQSAGPGAVQLPPPPLAWPAVRTNPTASLPSTRPLTMTQVSSVGVTTVVDSTLVERTRSLRDWLKPSKRSPNPGDLTLFNQVTL